LKIGADASHDIFTAVYILNISIGGSPHSLAQVSRMKLPVVDSGLWNSPSLSIVSVNVLICFNHGLVHCGESYWSLKES
jgi:hypothetical protein